MNASLKAPFIFFTNINEGEEVANMITILSMQELSKVSNHIDSALQERIINETIEKFETREGANLIYFDWLDIRNCHLKKHQQAPKHVILYQMEEDYIAIGEDEKTAERLEQFMIENDLLEKPFFYFFAALFKVDLGRMDDLEERITDMEDILLKDNQEDYTKGIIAFRRELLSLKRYYEQFAYIFDGILENENKLIPAEFINKFKVLDKRVDRLLAQIVNLRDYVSQVREAYQAQIDIQQNSLMKLFTVVTTIFTPLTLIVGWYGMNIQMPEYEWEFGHIFVIVLSISVVVGLLVYFRKRKWL